jgi:uncharacterized membrane protein
VIAWLGSRRGLTTLLVVSLAANLFLGGIMLGRFTGQVAHESQTRRTIQTMLAPLPDAKRQLVRKEIGVAMPRVREQFAELQKARAALAAEMVRPMPDSAALERGFATVQAHTAAIGGALQQAIVRALPNLSQDERRAMVDALARRRSSGAVPLP